MKMTLAAAVLALAAPLAAFAGDNDMIRVKSNHSVGETLGRLNAAVGKGGGQIFTVVDHGAGAGRVGADIGESKLVIFGNPKIGTPVMQANRAAGLYLPLRVLIYTDTDGSVWLAREDMTKVLSDLDGVKRDAPEVGQMNAALKKLTEDAAE